MTTFGFVILAILGIGFLIFIHEAGHYLAARAAGVRVEIFSLGFGPRLFGFVHNGCDYRLAAVPIGGFVQVAGQDVLSDDEPQPGELHYASVPARLLFYVGGVLMNLLFAVIAFPLVFHSGVDFDAPVIGGIQPGGAAWQADLRVGDRIASVDGKRMYDYNNLIVEVALTGDRGATLEVQRGDQTFTRTVTAVYNPARGVYSLGIQPASEEGLEVVLRGNDVAQGSGLETGDRIVAINGIPATAEDCQRQWTAAMNRTDPLEVTVQRGTEDNTTEHRARIEPKLRTASAAIGIGLAADRVAGLRNSSPALDALGLRVGDRILSVLGKPFGGRRNELAEAIAAGPLDQPIAMTVARAGRDAPLPLQAEFDAAQREGLLEQVALTSIGSNAEEPLRIFPQPDSPAIAAGVRAGDTVLAVHGRSVPTFEDLRTAVQRSKASIPVRVRHADGSMADLTIDPTTKVPDFGFTLAGKPLREIYRREGFGPALEAGFVCSMDLIKQLYVTLKKIFAGEVAAKNLGGIVTISRVTYHYAQSTWARFLYFLAMLSINLAFMNVLPIPVLDGGHLLFTTIEGIKGSPVSPRVLNYSQILGLVFVLALLVFVTYNDLRRLF